MLLEAKAAGAQPSVFLLVLKENILWNEGEERMLELTMAFSQAHRVGGRRASNSMAGCV